MVSKKNKKVTGGGNSVGNGKKEVIEDPRFSRVHFDPIFQNVPKNKSKVKLDKRFEGILSNKNFNTSSSARVDKRGKVKKQSENNLRQYYHLDEEEEEDKDEAITKKDKKRLKNKIEEVKLGEESGGESASSESESNGTTGSDDTDSDSDTDDDVDAVEVFGADTSVEVENVPTIEKETHRLAVVNMDWSHVKAVDLFVMLSSFLPKGGQIKSVAVYPSKFGLQRMEEEAIRGPVALFEDDKKKGEADSDEEDGDSDEDDEDSDEVSDNEGDADKVGNDEDTDEDDENEVSDGDEEDLDDIEDSSDNGDEDDDDDDIDEDDGEMDNEKLRAYEKSRLRYYFAVVECDSIATADGLYKACDGLEFERSSNVLDLRFVPDSMEFKHQPRDVATEAPTDYEGLDFQTRALQQSNTVLSWDEDEPHRVKTFKRHFDDNQLASMDVNEFLASDESESDEDDNGDQDFSEKKKKKADMYRALIQSGDGSEQEDEGQNMEVTFATGLEDISKKIIAKKEKGSETVFEAYLRNKKEKKIAKKNKSKTSSDDDSEESGDQERGEDPDDFFEEAPSVERRKKDGQNKKKSGEKSTLEKEAEASTAELELLLADENGENKKLKGYNLKQKKGKRKGKKGEETPDETNLPSAGLDDPRFSGLLVNPEFFLDPTDPQFKRSATYLRQLAQRQEKKPEEHDDVEPMEPSKKIGNSVGSTQKAEHELSAAIKSIKMKSQQLSGQSTVKIKDKMGSNGQTSGKKHKLPGPERAAKKSKLQKHNLSLVSAVAPLGNDLSRVDIG